MVGVAQLVRALVCGAGGRGFDPRHSPHFFYPSLRRVLLISLETLEMPSIPLKKWKGTAELSRRLKIVSLVLFGPLETVDQKTTPIGEPD